jgi:hypothetical protein
MFEVTFRHAETEAEIAACSPLRRLRHRSRPRRKSRRRASRGAPCSNRRTTWRLELAAALRPHDGSHLERRHLAHPRHTHPLAAPRSTIYLMGTMANDDQRAKTLTGAKLVSIMRFFG